MWEVTTKLDYLCFASTLNLKIQMMIVYVKICTLFNDVTAA